MAFSDAYYDISPARLTPRVRPSATRAPRFAAYKAKAPDYVDEFNATLARWHRATDASSMVADKITSPEFESIVRMGRKVIPLIVRELRSQPSFLFFALHKITGENVYPPNGTGDVSGMTDAWLAWADLNKAYAY